MKAKRRNERVSLDEEIEFLAPFAGVGRSVDIGRGGIGVEVSELLAVDTLVEMKIFGGHLIIQGRVRWAVLGANGYRVGIQFHEEDWGIVEKVQAMRSAQDPV